MKPGKKRVVIALAMAAVFAYTLWENFSGASAGTGPSGAAPEPLAVVVAAVLSALLVGAVMAAIFFVLDRFLKR